MGRWPSARAVAGRLAKHRHADAAHDARLRTADAGLGVLPAVHAVVLERHDLRQRVDELQEAAVDLAEVAEDEWLHLVELRLEVALRAAFAVRIVGPLRAVAALALPRPRRAALGAGRLVHLLYR